MSIISSSTENSSKRKFSKSKSKEKVSLKIFSSIHPSMSIFTRSFANGFFTEVNCRHLSESILDQLAQHVYQFVQKQTDFRRSLIYKNFLDETFLEENVHRIYLGDFEENSLKKCDFDSMNIILYKTIDENPFQHEFLIEGEKLNFGCQWKIPHQQFESIWENLQFDLPIKSQLINYVFTLIRFDQVKIDRNVVQCNQTILLYGPPGCGKTSLCKGLAQKVSIRMKEYFHRFYFYELNSSSLFSKWFSESSHNLSRFFDEILHLASDSSTYLIVLIDEIESLSLSRQSTMSSNEPSDMLRVVNTLLTQIDRLKSFSNILILTTSNLIEMIDQALIDRTDLILFIGPPSIKTICQIYRDCFEEFSQKNLIIKSNEFSSSQFDENLLHLSKLSEGFSGRMLRKLPMIAFSQIQQFHQEISSDDFLRSMFDQINQQRSTSNLHFDEFQR